MRIVLFGLTGIGNAVLRALDDRSLRPTFVVTRKERGPFPYYQERSLRDEADSLGIEVLIGSEGEARAQSLRPDLLLVATYHRILQPAIIQSAELAVNLHPSLLPTYRGASPFYWVIRNGEQTTGITAHLLTEVADAGDILIQSSVTIANSETQGTLRKKLADLAGEVANKLLTRITEGRLVKIPQDSRKVSWYPRVDDSVRRIKPDMQPSERERHIRALKPFPGALYD